MRARRVLVTGLGGPSGHAAATALKARGFDVSAADMREVAHPAGAFFLLPAAADPSFADALCALIDRKKIDWLFPTVSEELVKVASLAPELRARGVAVYVPPSEATRVCGDKWEAARAFQRLGIAVPRTAIGAADDPAVIALGFPVVSRPRSGRGGRGVVVHDAPGTPPAAASPIWQEFMPGAEYDVLLVRHPEPPHALLMQQVFEKMKLKEGRVGNALEVRPAAAQDVATLAAHAAAALDVRGPADIDVRRGADGAPRLLEINARIGAHSLLAPRIFDALVQLYESGCRG